VRNWALAPARWIDPEMTGDGVSHDDRIRAASAQIQAAERLFEESFKALSSARETLLKCQGTAFAEAVAAHPPCTVPITEHRRAHRSGRPPKIEQDPELQRFILARIDRLTYQQIADDIADDFPADRHVSKSTIHAWYQHQKAER
jgi:hypothetical protein